MAVLSKLWLALFFSLLIQQESTVDSVRARYHQIMAGAQSEGLVSTVQQLDRLANEFPAETFTPKILETIQAIALLHPQSVPDHAARFEKMQQQAGSNPALLGIAKRLEILRKYYLALAENPLGQPDADLSGEELEGSSLAAFARADAVYRKGNYGEALALAEQVIEADAFSPLNASAYVLMGLCSVRGGDAQYAGRLFQRAARISTLPTIYGNTENYLATLFRFIRPASAPAGGFFEEMVPARLAGASSIKDPRSLHSLGDKFLLIDREQVLVLSSEGKVLETKAGRRIEDCALEKSGKVYYLADDFVDLGTGSPTRISWSSGGKSKLLNKLKSLALAPNEDLYLVDQDAGIFVGRAAVAASIPVRQLSTARGRLIRLDRRGYIWVLAADQRSIMILSANGKQITSLAPTVAGGKEPSIEYFALDSLDHAYVLDSASSSIQIFALNEGGTSTEKSRIATVPLEPRPYLKNLKVLAVTPAGEIAVTGKNDDYWVMYR